MTGWRDLWFDVFHRWRWQRGVNRAWFAAYRWQQRTRREKAWKKVPANYAAAREAWWRRERDSWGELRAMRTKLKQAPPGTPLP